MITALLMGLVLVLICGGVHYVAMTTLHDRITGLAINRAAKAQLALLGLSVAHLVEAGVYTIGFRLGEGLDLGGFEGTATSDAMSAFYLGIGQIKAL